MRIESRLPACVHTSKRHVELFLKGKKSGAEASLTEQSLEGTVKVKHLALELCALQTQHKNTATNYCLYKLRAVEHIHLANDFRNTAFHTNKVMH